MAKWPSDVDTATRPPDHRATNGFTFVELLVAATIIAVLFVTVSAHLRGGLTVWRRATDQGEAVQRMRVALDRLERDVTQAIVYDDREDQYEGAGLLPLPRFGADALQFVTQAVTRAGLPPSVRVVSYRCDATGATPGLQRTSQSIREARSGMAPALEAMLPECTELSFQYAFQLAEDAGDPSVVEWRPTWPDDPDKPLRLPRLIEVTLQSATGRSIRRVMTVPLGQFGQPEPPPVGASG